MTLPETKPPTTKYHFVASSYDLARLWATAHKRLSPFEINSGSLTIEDANKILHLFKEDDPSLETLHLEISCNQIVELDKNNPSHRVIVAEEGVVPIFSNRD